MNGDESGQIRPIASSTACSPYCNKASSGLSLLSGCVSAELSARVRMRSPHHVRRQYSNQLVGLRRWTAVFSMAAAQSGCRCRRAACVKPVVSVRCQRVVSMAAMMASGDVCHVVVQWSSATAPSICTICFRAAAQVSSRRFGEPITQHGWCEVAEGQRNLCWLVRCPGHQFGRYCRSCVCRSGIAAVPTATLPLHGARDGSGRRAPLPAAARRPDSILF